MPVPKGQRFGGRQKGTPNKATTSTAEFINRVLTDEKESELWQFFLGHADPEVKFKAFRLSLEYKRGKPVQPIEASDSDLKFGAFTNGEDDTRSGEASRPN